MINIYFRQRNHKNHLDMDRPKNAIKTKMPKLKIASDDITPQLGR